MTNTSASVEPSRGVKLCGTEEIDPPSRKLTAGPLTAELENGQLRYIAFEGVEALRGIAFLVRDQNWGTYTPRIDLLSVEEGAETFIVEYRAVCEDANQRLRYEARITGSSDDALAFEAVATPDTDFVTNRAGFVVLHPAALAGGRLRVTRVDDREEETRFPELISPSQPVFNRKRPKAGLFDFITHTTCSIVHAADDRSVMETLEPSSRSSDRPEP